MTHENTVVAAIVDMALGTSPAEGYRTVGGTTTPHVSRTRVKVSRTIQTQAKSRGTVRKKIRLLC
jgi:hypothetical protein